MFQTRCRPVRRSWASADTSSGSSAPLLDQLEPRVMLDIAGNSSATSAMFTLAPAERGISAVQDQIGGGDLADLFRFEVPTQRDVGFVVSAQSGRSATLEMYLNTGALVAASRSPGITNSIAIELAPGTYYVRVVSEGESGSYQLLGVWTRPVGRNGITTSEMGTVAIGTTFAPGPNPPAINPSDTPAPPPVPSGDTAGNSASTARLIPSAPLGVSVIVQERVGDPDDPADLYRIAVTQRMDLGVMLSGVAWGTRTTANLDLEMFSEAGVKLGASLAPGVTPDYIMRDMSPGVYYLRVVVGSASVPGTDYTLSVQTGRSVFRTVVHTGSGTFDRNYASYPTSLFPPVFDLEPTPGGGGGGFEPPPPAPINDPPTGPVPPTVITVPPATPINATGGVLASSAFVGVPVQGTLNGNSPIVRSFSETPVLYGFRLAQRARIQSVITGVGNAIVEILRPDGYRIHTLTVNNGQGNLTTGFLASGIYVFRITPAAGAQGEISVRRA